MPPYSRIGSELFHYSYLIISMYLELSCMTELSTIRATNFVYYHDLIGCRRPSIDDDHLRAYSCPSAT